MSSTRLKNYLVSSRKRLALSQDEVAFLMGRRGGAKVSRYEAFARVPNLETALAFEVIYGKPIAELFAGMREEIAEEIRKRAKILNYRVSFQQANPRSRKKRAAVTSLITAPSVTLTDKS